MKICFHCRRPFNASDWQCPACHTAPSQKKGFLSFSDSTAADNYDRDYFEKLRRLEEGHAWFEARNRLILWSLKKHFPQSSHFLEVGCGTGFVLSGIHHQIPSLQLTGAEIYPEALQIAHERLKSAEFLHMGAEDLFFQEHFDAVGVFDVLEHLKNDGQALENIYQSVKSGGGVIVTVPQHPCLWNRFDDFSHHLRRYKASELQTKMEQAGFEVLETISFVSLLLPFLVLSRFLQSLQPKKNYDGFKELEISSVTNYLTGKVFDLERSLIQQGICFPAGNSLLMIGQKK